MAPTNPSPCEAPSDNGSPKLPSNIIRSEQDFPDEPAAKTVPFKHTRFGETKSQPHTNLEIESDQKRGSNKLCSQPCQADFNKCLHSFQ